MLADLSSLRDYLSQLPHSGATGSFLIAHSGEILLKQGSGFANRELRTENTPTTIFDIGSVAKVFTALAIFRLQSSGLLTLADPIERFLPNVPTDKRGITLHHLLTHSAGLEQYHSEGDFDPLSRDEAIAASLTPPLRWQPGERSGYSNAGYALLGIIVELVVAEPFQTYLRNHLLQPLALHDTGWAGESWLPANRLAHGYVDGEGKGSPQNWPLTWALLAGGGMVSTVEDLYRLHLALQGDTLLSPHDKQIMYTAPFGRWACCWEATRGEYGLLIKKGGSTDFGFTAWLGHYVDQQVALIFLLNSYSPEHGPATHNHVARELSALLFGSLPEAPYTRPAR